MTSQSPAVDRDLTYRRIDPSSDAPLAYANYREACVASFGSSTRCIGLPQYTRWLGQRVEEFPDGHVLAILNGQIVGQLELQVPYGLDRGYVNLFHVSRPWRRLGIGRRMHEFALRYFHSWEADWAELHVSCTNLPAVEFYRSLGYRVVKAEDGQLWRMERAVAR